MVAPKSQASEGGSRRQKEETGCRPNPRLADRLVLACAQCSFSLAAARPCLAGSLVLPGVRKRASPPRGSFAARLCRDLACVAVEFVNGLIL